MEVVDHPYLEGVKCRDDGAVFIPASGVHKGHWTFGSSNREGYLQVQVSRKLYRVHRLICEAFHGVCPEDKREVDHLERNPANNKPGNLRWVTPSENSRNKKVCIKGMEHIVSQREDAGAYHRAYYANNPECRERSRERCREWRAKKKAEMAQK